MNARKTSNVILVSAPNRETAHILAKSALKARLVACANLIPKIESHYWWRGKLESSAEVLILLKTTRAKLKALEKLIVAKHPYETPEFIVLPISDGNRRYLDWITDSVATQRGRSSKLKVQPVLRSGGRRSR